MYDGTKISCSVTPSLEIVKCEPKLELVVLLTRHSGESGIGGMSIASSEEENLSNHQ